MPDVLVCADVAAELDKPSSVDVNLTQHILVCALEELGCLVESLGTSASPLVSEPSTGQCESAFCSLLLVRPGGKEKKNS